MSTWDAGVLAISDPWEIFTALRYDVQLQLSNDEFQLRPDGLNSAFYLPECHRQRLIEAAKHYGWTDCIDHEALRDSASWKQCLMEHVEAYQDAKALDGVTSDTPLKVRIAFISPRILQACRDRKTSDISVSASPQLQEYMCKISGDSEALASGIQVSITAVPSQDQAQLFPTTLDLSLKDQNALTHQFTAVQDTVHTSITPCTYLKTYPRDLYDAAMARSAGALAKSDMTKDKATISNQSRAAATVHRMKEVILYNQRGEITEGSFTNVYFLRNGQWITPPVGREHGGLPGVARQWALTRGLCVEQVVLCDEIKLGEQIWLSNGVRGFMPGTVVAIGS